MPPTPPIIAPIPPDFIACIGSIWLKSQLFEIPCVTILAAAPVKNPVPNPDNVLPSNPINPGVVAPQLKTVPAITAVIAIAVSKPNVSHSHHSVVP